MSRRQRRAQQNKSTVQTADDIPYAQPTEKSKPAKTLFEIAAEKQAQLNPSSRKFNFNPKDQSNVVNVTIDKDGNVVPVTPSSPESVSATLDADEEAEISPWLDTLFLATSLSALHFTLEALTVHQYAQELKFLPIFQHTVLMALPTLTLIIHLFHGHLLPISTASLPEKAGAALYGSRQFLLLVIANVAGCYLIQLTNDKGYYAVMKNAPSIGTLWVWAILELGLLGAVLGVLGPGLYAWKMGYGVL